MKNVYALVGPDAFRRREALERICRQAMEAGDGDGPTRFDGDEAALADVLDEVRTFSLLGGRRLVVVEDAGAFITRNREALERYCAAPVDSGTLVLACDSLPSNTRLYRIIAKTGEIIECKAIPRTQIKGWIVQRARQAYGKGLDSQAADMLRELAGDGLDALDGELGKLALFVRQRPQITAADVEALVGRHREEDVFGVIDAMAVGDTAKALAQWERVLSTNRAAPAMAVGGLAWALRRLLEVKLQAESGTPIGVLARQAYAPPDVLERRLRMVSVRGLQKQMSDLLDADLASKTGLCAVDSAIEKFIVTHSTRAARARRTA